MRTRNIVILAIVGVLGFGLVLVLSAGAVMLYLRYRMASPVMPDSVSVAAPSPGQPVKTAWQLIEEQAPADVPAPAPSSGTVSVPPPPPEPAAPIAKPPVEVIPPPTPTPIEEPAKPVVKPAEPQEKPEGVEVKPVEPVKPPPPEKKPEKPPVKVEW